MSNQIERHELDLDKLDKIATEVHLLLSDNLIDFANKVINLHRPKDEVKVWFSEEDLHDLLNGEEFHWNFDNIELHLIQGNEDDEH